MIRKPPRPYRARPNNRTIFDPDTSVAILEKYYPDLSVEELRTGTKKLHEFLLSEVFKKAYFNKNDILIRFGPRKAYQLSMKLPWDALGETYLVGLCVAESKVELGKIGGTFRVTHDFDCMTELNDAILSCILKGLLVIGEQHLGNSR